MDNNQTNSDNTTNTANSKPKNRCHSCNKKVGLLGFSCKCGGNYCALHRFDIDHNCTFDFKSADLKKLKETNPKIIAEKIIKI
jgi:predicted nucleic acid binding AN1-type Zn finger protein